MKIRLGRGARSVASAELLCPDELPERDGDVNANDVIPRNTAYITQPKTPPSLSQPLAVVVVDAAALDQRVQCPVREVDSLACSSEDGERSDEDHKLGSAVEAGREQVVVLAEPRSAVHAEVVLREEGNKHGREDGGVDSD